MGTFTITRIKRLLASLKEVIRDKAFTDEMKVMECWHLIREWEEE